MGFWINAIFWAIIIGFYMWQAKPKPLTIAFIISLYVETILEFIVKSVEVIADSLSFDVPVEVCTNTKEVEAVYSGAIK